MRHTAALAQHWAETQVLGKDALSFLPQDNVFPRDFFQYFDIVNRLLEVGITICWCFSDFVRVSRTYLGTVYYLHSIPGDLGLQHGQ